MMEKKVLFRVKKHFWFWWCAWENEWSCLRDLTDHSFWSAQKKHDIEMISCWGKCSLFRRALLAMFVWLDLSRGSRAAEGSRSAAAVPGPTSGIAAALSVHRQSGLCSFLLDCRRKPYKQEYLWSRWIQKGFEQHDVLFNYPEFGDHLIIGKFCQIA